MKMNFSPAADKDFSSAVIFNNDADKFSSVAIIEDMVLP